jgi:diguanylate cyclase (GGDEF)-like protein
LARISAVGRDVTEQRRFEAALAHQATHDTLTDLPNRALLLDHLDLALARADRDTSVVALVFLDLDRFKSVNDTYGHDIGDDLLIAVAARITDVLRPGDTVARLGGDEFVILCEDVVDEHHAVAIAQRILSLIEATPFNLRGSEVDITASAGIAISPGGSDAHPEALLRDADAAMYRAKDAGRDRLELFDESMRRRAAERLILAEELSGAIDNAEIVIHYQPCVCLQSGKVVAVEALARWQHPERGLLAPTEFIGLAEDTGLIVGLGLRVLSDACAQAKQWLDDYGPDAPRVHVNLSARQLTAPNLSLLVRSVLEATGLTADRLCLEITESVLMEDAPTVIDAVRRLKDIGVSLAIDDFGTGYSSLSYLRRFPVDVLKVDQSFVDGLGPDSDDSAIVAAIVNLARILDLEAVAEGVETPDQLALLRELGCAAAQGYLFARPVPAGELAPLLQTRFAV